MAGLPVCDVQGEPRERGRVHGRLMARSVAANVATYLRRLEAGGLNREHAAASADEWGRVFAREADDYYDEMVGIAEGADVPFRDVALLNARYEITYAVFSGEASGRRVSEETAPDGCTSFGLLGEATLSGHTVIGQNWDWLADISGHCLVMRVRRADKPDFVGFTEAGIAGCKIGVNETGIGLVVNGLVTPEEGTIPFTRPFHLRCRDILDAERFDRAIAAVVSTPRTSSANFIIGHADGEIINIEATPNRCAYLYPEGGIVTHANHLEAEKRVESIFERLSPHSLFRGPRLRRHLQAAHGTLNHDLIAWGLRDHFSRPGSICRHVDHDLAPAIRVLTVTSAIINLNERTLWATAGPPCENPYQRIALWSDSIGNGSATLTSAVAGA